MGKLRPLIPLLLAIVAAIFLLFLQEEDVQPPEEQAIVLPEGSPNLYMTGVDITRYNEQGEATLHAQGSTLTSYSNPERTEFTAPTIHLIRQGERSWRITSNMAFVDENDIIDFRENVIATQLLSEPPLVLKTESLTVDPALSSVKTNLAVTVTQGKQQIKAIGMTAEIDTMDTIINFLSEVSFVYEP